jgi:CubicO group peptidase (beta-lactamase class C family)
MRCAPLALLASLSLALPLPAAPTSLPRAAPEAEGVDSAGLLSLVNAYERNVDAVHSIMIVRHGRVVAEGWWAPYAAGEVHILYSVTKSFTSTAVGLAASEGLLSINDRVLSFFPEFAPAEPAEQMKRMRLKDMLIMSTGHEKDTIDRMRKSPDASWVRTFLATDVEHKAGTRFVYNSGGSYVLAAVVQKVTGRTVEEYLTPRLFAPLGIESHPWYPSKEGVDLGDGGLSLRTEDLAKFGQLLLQRGSWEGRQVLPAAWVDAATSRETSSGSDPDDNWEAGYGYQFWRNKVGGYRADGALGQYCIVIPELDLVVAITSGTANLKGVMDTTWECLLPALHPGTLPDNSAALGALRAKLAGLALRTEPGSDHAAIESQVSGSTYLFAPNELGITAVTADFGGPDAALVITDADGAHRVSVGRCRWARSRTDFQRGISNLWTVPDQPLAARGSWQGGDTFVAELCFTETPYILTLRLQFSGDTAALDLTHNVRWGRTTHPRMFGSRAAAAAPQAGR